MNIYGDYCTCGCKSYALFPYPNTGDYLQGEDKHIREMLSPKYAICAMCGKRKTDADLWLIKYDKDYDKKDF